MIQDLDDVLMSGSELARRWMYLRYTYFTLLFFLQTGECDWGQLRDFICLRVDAIFLRQL
jgi:hypothetical protein